MLIVAEHAEGTGRVAELAGDLGGGTCLEEIGAQRLVLALARRAGRGKEAAAFR